MEMGPYHTRSSLLITRYCMYVWERVTYNTYTLTCRQGDSPVDACTADIYERQADIGTKEMCELSLLIVGTGA